MSVDPQDRPEQSEVAEGFKRVEEKLAEDDRKIAELDEGIREAERKSKKVIPDIEPMT